MTTVKLLQLNVPNKSGRIYTKKCMEEAIREYKPEGVSYIQSKPVLNIPIEEDDILGHVENLRIEENILVADCYFYEAMAKYVPLKLNVRPVGTALVDEDGTVTEYRIHGFTIVLPPKIV
jgi:hypothetical protein